MTSNAPIDWASHSGDAWTRRWRELDVALADLTPALHSAIVEGLPLRPFTAFDMGCGAGSTSEWLALERPDAAILACDLSPSLVRLAAGRLAPLKSVRVVLGDGPAVAVREGPFDLVFSRHGVMFFADPLAAFQTLRAATAPGGALVFSCFQDWQANHWASVLASAVAGRAVPPPGKEAGGFAFADPDMVSSILESAGWIDASNRLVPFSYVAGAGLGALDEAVEFLSEIGPAARLLDSLPNENRPEAIERMSSVIKQHELGDKIVFPAAAWIWSARAPG